MYIVALNGSHNKSGNCQFLIDTILQDCKNSGAIVETINVHEAVMDAKTPFCSLCTAKCVGECYKETKLEEAYEKIAKADGVIMASPVYFGNVTAQLKAFWDKTRSYRATKAFVGKPIGFVACRASRVGGQEDTIRAMQTMALVQGMTVINSGHWDFDAGHMGVSAQRPASEDEFAISRCHSMAKRIMDEIQK